MREGSAGGGYWIALKVRTPAAVHEALVNFLVEETRRGVEVAEEWVTAYCRKGREAETCLGSLRRYYGALRVLQPELPELEVVREELADQDWGEAWKEFFKPTRIGNTIVVKPTWEPYQPGTGEVVIEIDPGRAFGTGGHPSTALCIEELEHLLGARGARQHGSAPSVLDVGTGTGILGIVAARLGAARVLGLEVDRDALEAAAGNVERNGVAEIMRVSELPLHHVEETFQVVVANLSAPLLEQMADEIARRVCPGGRLLLSGIVLDQVEEVLCRFTPPRFALVHTRAREEWRALLLEKEGEPPVL
jgi:ribosomal protein L11 methyltransferase